MTDLECAITLVKITDKFVAALQILELGDAIFAHYLKSVLHI